MGWGTAFQMAAPWALGGHWILLPLPLPFQRTPMWGGSTWAGGHQFQVLATATIQNPPFAKRHCLGCFAPQMPQASPSHLMGCTCGLFLHRVCTQTHTWGPSGCNCNKTGGFVAHRHLEYFPIASVAISAIIANFGHSIPNPVPKNQKTDTVLSLYVNGVGGPTLAPKARWAQTPQTR